MPPDPAYPKPVLVATPPTPGVPPPAPAPVQSRPKTVQLKCQRLRSLPHRLLHPPPARGKLPSWGVTPRFEVNLDEILDRKHLPPLGLKDFEEWLLFVEQSAENLYFILWLRDYTQRYSEWVQRTRSSRTSIYGHERGAYRTPSAHPPASPELAYSYLRAKRTFLTPNANYELDVPSDILAPFHIAPGVKSVGSLGSGDGEEALSEHTGWSATTCAYGITYGSMFNGFDGLNYPAPPPDPAVFGELAEVVREMLRDSLERFVTATFNNVGTPRAVCGSAGGIVIGLVGSVPLIVNFAVGGSRWWRLAAIPGMWLGLTIFISAMYGVCMMIYVFGDLRQLRSFELVRPPISDPQPIPSPSASASSLFQPRSPSTAPRIPTFTQFIPFRRTPRRSIPPISPPMSVTLPPYVGDGRAEMTEKSAVCSPKLHIVTPRVLDSRLLEESSIRPPQRAVTRTSRRSGTTERGVSRVSSLVSISDAEYTDDEDSAHDSGYEDDEQQRPAPRIEISDAFYDEHPSPEGPATASFPGPGLRNVPLWPDYEGNDEEELNATAAFIHPFTYEDALNDKEGELSIDLEAQTGRGAAARQPVGPFNFDALPLRRPRFANPGKHRGSTSTSGRGDQLVHKRSRLSMKSLSPRSVMGLWQTKCSPENVVRVHIQREIIRERERESLRNSLKENGGWGIGWGVAESPLAASPTLAGSPVATSTFTFPAVATTATPSTTPASVEPVVSSTVSIGAPIEASKAEEKEPEKRKKSWHSRLRRVNAVPAFAVPLTPVLNPVVTRAQWEIVVRSATIAFVVCVVVVGGLTGAPVPHH
ncbi:hypothetical protein WOLCODRAFT_98221 [Wolfiporia cocos MD-104 SS10]|uniref:RGS domain-containing protein n=1 Tax=Wolfiporia cocos (strain MD-104) TaxID=742152 RepID=A0A2H3JV92_WOLCO|nr:hypothetical protein WOLCODRAFT_98221 [Wolfiporia cocos MD-104 SS10]